MWLIAFPATWRLVEATDIVEATDTLLELGIIVRLERAGNDA